MNVLLGYFDGCVIHTSIEYTVSMERFAGLYFCSFFGFEEKCKSFSVSIFYIRIMALFKYEAPQKFSCKNFIGFESVKV